MFSTLRLKVLTFSYSGSSSTSAPTSSSAAGSTARHRSVSGPLTCSPPLPLGLQFLQWTVNIKCLPSCATITAMSAVSMRINLFDIFSLPTSLHLLQCLDQHEPAVQFRLTSIFEDLVPDPRQRKVLSEAASGISSSLRTNIMAISVL